MDLEPQGKLHIVIDLKWVEPEDGGVRPREFRERQGFNRRRGAMRRRVHQVRWHAALHLSVFFDIIVIIIIMQQTYVLPPQIIDHFLNAKLGNISVFENDDAKCEWSKVVKEG